MPVLSPDVWEMLRLDYEAGRVAIRELAKRYGVDKKTITNRARKQRWLRDPRGELEEATVIKVVENEAKRARKKASPRVAPTQGAPGEPPPPDGGPQPAPTPTAVVRGPLTREEAIEAEASRRASVVTRHRDEWDRFEHVVQAAMQVYDDPPMITRVVQTGDKVMTYEVPDFSKIDAAKRLGEILMIRQKGERASFQLDKNVNTDKVVEAEERDRIVQDTFRMLREAAKKAAERAAEKEAEGEKIIDITPTKGTA